MSIDFADTTARFTYLTPDEVADLDHPAFPCADGRAGLALGDEGAVVLGTPSELRTWLTIALDAALNALPAPEQTDSHWWVCIEREFGDDVAVGPYDDERDAARDLEDGHAVAALCEQDALDAYLTADDPEPGRVRLHPDGTPYRPGDGYERTALPEHTNDLGDWCPFSGTTARTDGACPQGCTAADG